MEKVSKINVFRGRERGTKSKNLILTGSKGADTQNISALFLFSHAAGIKPYGVFYAHFLLSAENCIKKGGKSAVPSPVCHEPKGAWLFSHAEDIGGIQTDETPKINTFQTMRKEVSGMAVFRIEKTRDYTVMSNHHLRNTDLSLKAKGLLSLMLSLPEEWDYTTKGLARICKDGVDSIVPGFGSCRITGM